MKIGVIYCKPGQKTEEEMFGNGTKFVSSLHAHVALAELRIIG